MVFKMVDIKCDRRKGWRRGLLIGCAEYRFHWESIGALGQTDDEVLCKYVLERVRQQSGTAPSVSD